MKEGPMLTIHIAANRGARMPRSSAILTAILLSITACGRATPDPSPLPPGAGKAVEMQVSAANAWTRQTSAGFNGALYVELVNASPIEDRLTGVLFDGASRTEIHRTVRDGDMMRMEHQAEGVGLPAGERIDLAPGGYHVMLIDLRQDLVAGETVSMTLEFEEAGRIPIPVEVRSPDALP